MFKLLLRWGNPCGSDGIRALGEEKKKRRKGGKEERREEEKRREREEGKLEKRTENGEEDNTDIWAHKVQI